MSRFYVGSREILHCLSRLLLLVRARLVGGEKIRRAQGEKEHANEDDQEGRRSLPLE